ncbi:MAG: type II secretion system F family protein [bacterium]
MAGNMLVFIAVASMTMAIISMVKDVMLKDRRRISNRVERDFRALQREQVKESPLFREPRKNAIDTSDLESFIQPKKSLDERLEELIMQSGVHTNKKTVLRQSVLAAVGAGVLTFLVLKNPIPVIVLSLVCGAIPVGRLAWIRRTRQNKLRSQLPEAFDLMARVVRAGQTINQAILAVSDEFPRPISEEFSYCFEQQNLGISPEAAVRDLAKRTGVLELRIFVTALIVQQQTGGNLAELIDKLSTMIRSRFRIMGQIKTLTSEGRLQAMILLALPIVMFFVLMIINPAYEIRLIEHPVLVYITLTLMSLGAWCIRAIVNFDF